MTTRKPIDLNPQHKPSDFIEMGLSLLQEGRDLLAAAVEQTQEDNRWNKLDRELNKLDRSIEETQSVPTVLKQENL